MQSANKTTTKGPLVTASELATFLGVSMSTVRRLIRDHQVPVVRVRGAIRFNVAAVEAVLTNADEEPDQ